MQEADIMRRLMKDCTMCGQVLPVSHFPINRLGRHGVGAWCKPCFAERARVKYRENREREIARSRSWAINNPGRVAANMRKLRHASPDHYRAYKKDYERNNPDRVRATHRKKEAKRRGAIMNSPGMALGAWEELLVIHDFCCAYCGSARSLQMDHVVPLSRGGSHCPENILPACAPCNLSKNAASLSDWAARAWVGNYA